MRVGTVERRTRVTFLAGTPREALEGIPVAVPTDDVLRFFERRLRLDPTDADTVDAYRFVADREDKLQRYHAFLRTLGE